MPPVPPLRVGRVPGVNPGRWIDTWRGRYRDEPLEIVELAASEAEDALLHGAVDVAFLRLPLTRDGLVRIPLWSEETVVAVSRESELTLLGTLSPHDLAGQTLLVPADDVLAWRDAPGEPFGGVPPATTEEALELVAHEAGVCVLPKAIARALQRRDVELLGLVASSDEHGGEASGGEPSAIPTSAVGIAWVPQPDGEPTESVERFVGIVRGRTASSSRGRADAAGEAEGSASPKAAKQARRPARGATTARRTWPRGRRHRR